MLFHNVRDQVSHPYMAAKFKQIRTQQKLHVFQGRRRTTI
jgi:hypothetical protein